MIVYKYSKTHPASLAGHMDTVRTFMRMLRRAKCEVAYSVGFNPHMLVFASPALPVGVDSMCEYMAVDMKLEDNIVARLNAVSPRGIAVLDAVVVDNINLSNEITKAVYNIYLPNISSYVDTISAKPCVIEFMAKGQQTEKEVSQQIHGVSVMDNDNISIVLDCGNVTLRADRIVAHLLNKNALDCDYLITKTNMLVGDISVDNYLKTLNTAS